MASHGNLKLPLNLDKPPLFNSGYRVVGSEPNKPVNFNSFPPMNNFKVPKLENDLCFTPDLDTPSVKRPKFTEESHQPQIQPLQHQKLTAVPLFLSQRSPLSIEHEDDYVKSEDMPSPTIAKSIDTETHFNPLTEPSPLGLNLRKSPSLLDLIQRKLAQTEDDGSERSDQGGNLTRLGSSGDKDKLKAANFPASKLRIGTWECASRYDGDLVAKCYYAKRKLVWEVLDSDLKIKSKMEVQWSDISALKASFPDDQPAVFDIELSRPPLFFREINPQPRKHTIWQSTSDFTDGQATICRHHSLQFPVGVLNRHFEKLLQSDERLKVLHEQTRSIQDSCFFDSRSMQIDRQHMMHYQSVLSDHAARQPLAIGGMNEEALLSAMGSVDCSQSHVSLQGFQNDSLQRLSPHHENRKTVKLEGIRSEALQQTAPVHTNVMSGAGVRRLSGGFLLQFATGATPSSAMDTRVLNESSSGSETEEAPQARTELLNFHISQEKFRQFSPLKSDEWRSRHLQDGSMAWNVDSGVSSSMNQEQALNELSRHLLGEPIASTDPCQLPLGRANGRAVHEMVVSTGGTSNLPQAAYFNKDFVHKNIGIMHHGSHLAMGERTFQWNAVSDNHSLEAGSVTLPSHGSSVDLVYLPRIASQPKFYDRGQ